MPSILGDVSVIDRVLPLWTQPVPDGAEALARFAEAYTDPVSINGADVPLTDLVERARGLQRAFADLRIELIEQMEAPERVAIVFLQRGRHVGPARDPAR